MTSQDNSFTIPKSAQNQPAKTVGQQKKKWYRRWWGRIVIVFCLLLLAMIIAMVFYVVKVTYLLRSGAVTSDQLFGTTTSKSAGTQGPTYAKAGSPSIGDPKAPVVVVEFSDFQCPFCQAVHPVIKELLKNYGDKIFFVYRDFPLESIHPQAVVGSLAGQCAAEQGKFWEMHDKIFDNQDQLSSDSLKIWAVQLGLNSLQFSACLDSAKYFDTVNQDLQDGIAAGVQATPTFFINGKKLEGALPLATFEQIILSEISR